MPRSGPTTDPLEGAARAADAPVRRPVLLCLEPRAVAALFAPTGETVRIGRDPLCELRFEDAGCSRFHARLELRPPLAPGRPVQAVLEDLQSRNGTFVNDHRIRTPRLLRNHDRIGIGGVRLAHLLLDDQEVDAERAIVRAALTDPLTGVPNRLAFEQDLAVEIVRARRYQWPLAYVAIDLDRFKRVNDTVGHAGGDEVLVGVARELQARKRPTDLLGRIGGEELAVVLPQTDRAGALAYAERLRLAIAALRVPWEGRLLRVTASLGVAVWSGEAFGADVLAATADAALYRAKAEGRNRVVALEMLTETS
jgi:diguanylate cyclase (GGDEF)-like protein